MSIQLTFGSLFAGIGGFDLGFERAGMVCKWQVEIDAAATTLLRQHWPSVQRERDVTECDGNHLPWVNVICGGFPCQDISVAGEGAGLDGKRSGLFFQAIRLVDEMQPDFVVLENVAALLGRGLDRVLATLADVGFDAEWRVLSASRFGLFHRRRRIFIIAYARRLGIEGPITGRSLGVYGQRGPRSQADMQSIYDAPFIAGDRWPKPMLRRTHDGFSRWVDRIRCLGNAIVPDQAEWIGRRIVESAMRTDGTRALLTD